MKVPKCMSTQHPDNVNNPFFSSGNVLSRDDEVMEVYYVFSHLNCDEQMWDYEGKEVDNYVVSKLLRNYSNYFKENKLGDDYRLTLRVPNPWVEKFGGKILIETLQSVPRSYDVAKAFYKNETSSPIFEVILPMATSAEQLSTVHNMYPQLVSNKEDEVIKGTNTTLREVTGEYNPKQINVIPLFEDSKRLLKAHDIMEEYLEDKGINQQRVFLARSDPALNYGLVSAVLLNKLCLQNLSSLSERLSCEFYPIIGVGSAPFRGNLKPGRVKKVMNEYPSVHTYTIQSSFKYDNDSDEVRRAVNKIRNSRTGNAQLVPQDELKKVINKYSEEYKKQVIELSDVINKVASHVLKNRLRKIHVGLYGYSREVEGVNLPRAIKFTASLYSIGSPPELLGLNALNGKDLETVLDYYEYFKEDLRNSLEFFNPGNPFTPEEVKESISEVVSDYEINHEHESITNTVINSLRSDEKGLERKITAAANIRGFLG